MSLNGFFPMAGVPADQANNSYVPLTVPGNEANCDINWYPAQRCVVKVDTDAINGIMAELLCMIDMAKIAYDCLDVCQLGKAARRLSVTCRSSITPAPGVWPPVAYTGDLLTDDTDDTYPNIWYWDCNSNVYRAIVERAEVVCRSQLVEGPSFPPTTFQGKIIVDDINDATLTVWFWDCNSSIYRTFDVAETAGCNFFWADSVYDAAGLGGGITLTNGTSITVPLNIPLHCLPQRIGVQLAVQATSTSFINVDCFVRLRGSGVLIASGSVGGSGGPGVWCPLVGVAGSCYAASGLRAASPPDFPVRSTTSPLLYYSKDSPIDIELKSRDSVANFKIRGVALFDGMANAFDAYTAPDPGPGTCFPAGSLVRMADGSRKAIQAVRVGDVVWTPTGTDVVSDSHATTLGDRKLFRMEDHSILWSEEHSFWVDRDGDQRLWSMNVDLLIDEARSNHIIGLKDWDWPFEGAPERAEKFARDDGSFVPHTPVRVRGASKTELLYFVETKGGGLISVNGYVVGAGLDDDEFDYKSLKITAV